MAVYGDITFDSRVRREAAALASDGYDVTLVCLGGADQAQDLPPGVRVVEHRPTVTSILPGTRTIRPPREGRARRLLGRLTWLRAYVPNLRAWGREVPGICGDVDIWHLHDLTALAGVLPTIRTKTPVVYDAHELFLESGTAALLPGFVRRLLRGYERRLISRVAAVVTVNDEIASELRRRYGPPRTEVVHNCPDRWTPPATRPSLIRDTAGIPAESPVVLYHGALGPHRGIESLMDALLAPGMGNVHLALLGPGVARASYVEMARDQRWGGRVHVLDAVRPSELLPWVASADVGAMPLRHSTVNHYLATPNKLFECLAAGVPVIVSDFPAMRRIVTADPGGPLGVVCDPDSVDSVARAVLTLLELGPADAERMRARCLTAARERWNWDAESGRLLSLYRDLLPRV